MLTLPPLPSKFFDPKPTLDLHVQNWRNARLRNLSKTDRKRDDSRVDSGFGKKVADWVGRDFAYPTNVLHMATECGNKGHAATYPPQLPAWFVKLFTEPGDLVLDPFMGSGTTALACQQIGRHFVGIELSPQFCKLAENRILGIQGERTLFDSVSA